MNDNLADRQHALTVADVASLLNVSNDKVKVMVAAGEIPSFKIGRSTRFDPQLFADWLKTSTSKTKFETLAARHERLGKRPRG